MSLIAHRGNRELEGLSLSRALDRDVLVVELHVLSG